MVIRKLKWLWLIGNRISCRPILSVIILVINKSDRMITDQIGLHSVLLPLFMERGGGVGNQVNFDVTLPDSPDLAPPPPLTFPPSTRWKKNFRSPKQNSQIKLTHGRGAFWFSLGSPWTQLTQLTVGPLRTDRRTTRSTSACIHLSLDKVFFWLAIHSLCSFSLKSFALGFWSSFSCLTIRMTSSEPIVAPYMWYQKRIQKDRPSSLTRSMALSFAFLGLDVSI